MDMFKSLLPKEDKYFDDFREMIANIREMAEHTQQLFSADTPDVSMILKIKPLESRCDEILNRVIKRLNKTFITPFDREDIFALIKRLDDISDMLLGASSRIETFSITKKISHSDKLAAIILQQIKELDTAIQDLRGKRSNECKAVKDLEREADNVYKTAIKELFTRETDAIKLIKEKEILELLEEAADKCQSTANVILSIFIKNA
jgi:uncharacterized protein